jgi:SAM-dependent methyltransferase
MSYVQDKLRRVWCRALAFLARVAEKQARRRWPSLLAKLPRAPDGKLLIHIGCGDIASPNFVNIDARPLPHVHIVTDNLFRLAMIPDGAADLIYMSHVLEHVSHTQLRATLLELRRVLKPGGVLRLSVPDFDKLLDVYEKNEREIAAIEQPLMGGQDYAYNFHYCIFNRERLKASLASAGLIDAREWNPANCEHHDFTDWADRQIEYKGVQYPVSLNIEASAP